MLASEQIIQVLNALCEKMGIVVDWTAQNAIPVAQKVCERFIHYEITRAILAMILWLCVIAGLVFGGTKIFKFFIKRIREQMDIGHDCFDIGTATVITGFIFTVLITIVVGKFVTNADILCKCLVCPELHIFEEFKYLLK